MGLGFLTLGDSIDVVLWPGCPTLTLFIFKAIKYAQIFVSS